MYSKWFQILNDLQLRLNLAQYKKGITKMRKIEFEKYMDLLLDV